MKTDAEWVRILRKAERTQEAAIDALQALIHEAEANGLVVKRAESYNRPVIASIHRNLESQENSHKHLSL